MKKKPAKAKRVCKACGGSKVVQYYGRTYTCGECATDVISKLFRKVRE